MPTSISHVSPVPVPHLWECLPLTPVLFSIPQVYSLPSMALLDKKSIKMEGLGDFQWSPKEPIIAAYQAEDTNGNRPARVVLVKVSALHFCGLSLVGAWHVLTVHGSRSAIIPLWAAERYQAVGTSDVGQEQTSRENLAARLHSRRSPRGRRSARRTSST